MEDRWGHGVYFSLSGVSRVLVISDPFFPLLTNNIGKSVFAMWRIKSAFEEGHAHLSAQFTPHAAAPTLLARIIQKMQQYTKKRKTTTTEGGQTEGHHYPTPHAPTPVRGLVHIALPALSFAQGQSLSLTHSNEQTEAHAEADTNAIDL